VGEETKNREQVVPRVAEVVITAVQVAPMRKKVKAVEAKDQASMQAACSSRGYRPHEVPVKNKEPSDD